MLTEGKADAALAASIFHFREHSVGAVKQYLAGRGVKRARALGRRSRPYFPLAGTKTNGLFSGCSPSFPMNNAG